MLAPVCRAAHTCASCADAASFHHSSGSYSAAEEAEAGPAPGQEGGNAPGAQDPGRQQMTDAQAYSSALHSQASPRELSAEGPSLSGVATRVPSPALGPGAGLQGPLLRDEVRRGKLCLKTKNKTKQNKGWRAP